MSSTAARQPRLASCAHHGPSVARSLRPAL